MVLLAGEVATAAKLMRLQPKTYQGICSSTLTGAVTDADIVGATVTLTTETANATYWATASVDFNIGSADTTLQVCRLSVDASIQPALALFQGEITTDRVTVFQQWNGTLGAAGAHTLKLIATLSAGESIEAVHTKIHVVIFEVV